MTIIKKFKNYYKILSIIFLFLWLFILLSQKIDLAAADIGRHIKNGEIMLKTLSIPKTNLYSYTYPDYPAVNHHWGSGVLFYIIYKMAGFEGLSIFYIAGITLAFALILRISLKTSGFAHTLSAAILLIPLIAFRREIRPEVLSYIFTAFFYLMLTSVSSNRLSRAYLLLLPAVQIFWVNLHIYFFLGPLIIGIFFLEKLLARRHPLYYLFILALDLSAAFINPFGLKGVLYPFSVMKNYGYRLVENSSIWFLEGINYFLPAFLHFKIAAAVIILGFIISNFINRRSFRFSVTIISFIFLAMAAFAIRNLTLFALVALPALSYFLSVITRSIPYAQAISHLVTIMLVVIFFPLSGVISWKDISGRKNSLGVGLVPQSLSSVEFFQKNSLPGPVFNNYDIGSYLIFGLFPKQKIFVDNRPESYPENFFTQTYIPMQEDANMWQKLNTKYGFQTIFFSHRDLTPWGQKFLIDRVNDPDWVPVYADAYAIIFAKKTVYNMLQK